MTPVSDLERHRELIEDYLATLQFAEELGGLTEAMRYSLEGGSKRIRPLLCLASGEAMGAEPEQLLPAAIAIELVHTFGMVHDDLPALDDDDLRRGRATSHVEFDEATAILNELSRAAIGMIGGQYDDIRGAGGDLVRRHALKTGRLFEAAVGCAIAVADVPSPQQEPWRAFAADFGLLYQVVDDMLDGDGLASELGREGASDLADEIESRARARLREIRADTTLLDELLSGLKQRTERLQGADGLGAAEPTDGSAL